jgi:uncharacterized protein DUF397
MIRVTSSPDGDLQWKKSSFSAAGNCVEFASAPDDLIAVRDSKHPDAGFLLFTRPEVDAFVRGVVAGEFDDFR